MKLVGVILSVLVLAVLGAFFWFYDHDRVQALINPPQEPLIATVELVNACHVSDRAFVVTDLETGHRVPFVNRKARVRTYRGSSLQVQLNPKYGNVLFTGPKEEAEERVVMHVDCANRASFN